MGSDESRFNVSLTARGKATRQCPQITISEEKGETKRIWTEGGHGSLYAENCNAGHLSHWQEEEKETSKYNSAAAPAKDSLFLWPILAICQAQ